MKQTFDYMKKSFLTIILSAFCGWGISFSATAQNPQQQEPPTPEELAAKEADRLGELLELEAWQIFYVDSTLQHDYAALQKEMEEMMKSRVDNYHLYQNIQDKWMEHIEKTYRKYFNEDQWKKYLKSGAGKQIKAREKRKAKMNKEAQKKK